MTNKKPLPIDKYLNAIEKIVHNHKPNCRCHAIATHEKLLDYKNCKVVIDDIEKPTNTQTYRIKGQDHKIVVHKHTNNYMDGSTEYFAFLPAFGQAACSAIGNSKEEAIELLIKVKQDVIQHYINTGTPVPETDTHIGENGEYLIHHPDTGPTWSKTPRVTEEDFQVLRDELKEVEAAQQRRMKIKNEFQNLTTTIGPLPEKEYDHIVKETDYPLTDPAWTREKP